jgi:hypothetical protein
MRVRKPELGELAELAEGGFGKVYRVPGYRLPGDPVPLAYKEFTSEEARQARSAEAAVSFRAGLSQPDRDDLDRHTVWPRALVEDRGVVAGLLMPLIPDDYFCDQADDATGELKKKPLEMQWLIATADQLSAAQIRLRPLEKSERLILLGQLIYAIGRLHKHGWVFGDLSFTNSVFALDPPRVLLLDCDGAASLGDLLRKQAHTPFWDPPECSSGMPYLDLQDKATDVYKLGLAILRCLSPGKGAASSRSAARAAGELDPEGLALVERAVNANPDMRPTAKELYAYLSAAVARRVQPPAVLTARLATPLRVRGMDARIDWHIKGATTVNVRIGDADPVPVPVTGDPQSYTFRPRESGPVAIEVSSKFGTLPLDLGELTLYELPELTVDLARLPRLDAPSLGAFTLDTIRPALASVPRAPVPDVPRIPALPTADLIGVFREALMPGGAIPLELPRLGDVITRAANEVAGIVLAEAKQTAESRRQAHLASQANVENDDR